jgi:HEAT repeat protein
VLAKIGSDKALNTIISALQDNDRSTRMNAARTLEKIGSEKAVDALIKALYHKNPQFRYFIYTTLRGIHHPKAAAAAKEYLLKIKKKEK